MELKERNTNFFKAISRIEHSTLRQVVLNDRQNVKCWYSTRKKPVHHVILTFHQKKSNQKIHLNGEIYADDTDADDTK